jgi:hypothetical protein
MGSRFRSSRRTARRGSGSNQTWTERLCFADLGPQSFECGDVGVRWRVGCCIVQLAETRSPAPLVCYRRWVVSRESDSAEMARVRCAVPCVLVFVFVVFACFSSLFFIGNWLWP